MAWIELHDTLPDHDKVILVADLLKMDKDMVVGKLVRLWTWALNNREDGTFRKRDAETIAEIMRYKGKPQRLVDAMVESHLLDVVEEVYVIHGWDERVGMLRAKRETQRAQAKQRAKRFRDAKKGVVTDDNNANVTRYASVMETQNNADTVPKPYLIEEDEEDSIKQEARAREEFKQQIGREPTGAEASALSGCACVYDADLVLRALEQAGYYAAAAPMPYVNKTLDGWSSKGIRTVDQLDYQMAMKELGRESVL